MSSLENEHTCDIPGHTNAHTHMYYVCMCICIHPCICIGALCMHVYMNIFMCVSSYVYEYIHICMCVSMHMFMCLYV